MPRITGHGSRRKVMKPCSELNPRVWQGDCLLGIDQKHSEMFQNCGAGGPVLGTDNVHHPDNTARHSLPTPPRFPAGANWVQGGRAIALTNGGGPKLFPTAKRFSSQDPARGLSGRQHPPLSVPDLAFHLPRQNDRDRQIPQFGVENPVVVPLLAEIGKLVARRTPDAQYGGMRRAGRLRA
jgi:hypothetical protein